MLKPRNQQYLDHIKSNCKDCIFDYVPSMSGNWCEICGQDIEDETLVVVKCRDEYGFVACVHCIKEHSFNPDKATADFKQAVEDFKRRIS